MSWRLPCGLMLLFCLGLAMAAGWLWLPSQAPKDSRDKYGSITTPAPGSSVIAALPALDSSLARLSPRDLIIDQTHHRSADGQVLRRSLVACPHLDDLHLFYEEMWEMDGPTLVTQQWQVAEHAILQILPSLSARQRLAQALPEVDIQPLDGDSYVLARFAVRSADDHAYWLDLLGQQPEVKRVEPDTLMWFTDDGDDEPSDIMPNDPLFSQQWALRNQGQVTGRSGADISATKAWTITTGSDAVVVAVIDTGIKREHEDLVANIWTNPLESDNGKDDSGNGKIDDLQGWNFADDSNDISDVDGHGTHIAGIIAAHTDNLEGIAGVSWHSQLMALKVGTGTSFPVSRAVSAIAYADEQGAHLINMSWAASAPNSSLRDAIANRPHILFAAAAGNDGNDIDLHPTYPAAYTLDNLITVTASTANDTLPSFANTGLNRVHITAPGGAILSTWIDGVGYDHSSGTSMAVPHVLGVAALLLAENPSLSPYQLRSIMMLSGDLLTALYDTTISGRRLNAHAALTTQHNWPAQPRRIGDLRVWEDGELRASTVMVEQDGDLHYQGKTGTHDIGGLLPYMDIELSFPLEADG